LPRFPVTKKSVTKCSQRYNVYPSVGGEKERVPFARLKYLGRRAVVSGYCQSLSLLVR